jgi:YD repeat-containing protein
MNRVDSLADGVNTARTRLGYDGNLLSRLQDPKGQVYRFAYNAAGWLTRRYDPADTLNRYDQNEFDRSGLVRRWTNRRGQTIALAYDSLGRPMSKSGTNTTTETWGYSNDFRRLVAVGDITRDSVFLSPALLVDSAVTWFCEPTCTKRFRILNVHNARGPLCQYE